MSKILDICQPLTGGECWVWVDRRRRLRRRWLRLILNYDSKVEESVSCLIQITLERYMSQELVSLEYLLGELFILGGVGGVVKPSDIVLDCEERAHSDLLIQV
jgi:hypothetical protein